MKRMMIIAGAAFLAASAVSCTGQQEPEGKVQVQFQVSGDGTRSVVDAPEDGISTLLMLFYENGVLLPQLTVSTEPGGSSASASVPLDIGHTYQVAVFANCSLEAHPATSEEALGLHYTCDGVQDWNSGIPMSGYQTVRASYAMPPVQVRLVRLASRLDLTIDTSGLEHGSIEFSSVAVRQMNRDCPFFSQGVASESGGVCDGDCASASDILQMNSEGAGYSTAFYLLENLQGDILYGNADPDAKTPDAVMSAGGNPGLCTYLEITGKYSDRSGHLNGENLTAHLYLGSNPVSNFDLVRNCRYAVTLRITDDGCLRTDWKIDGGLDDSRELRFREPALTVGKGTSVNVPLVTNLSFQGGDYSYTVTGDTAFFSVVPSEGGFSVASDPSVTNGKHIVITAATWDGAHVSSCRVTAQFTDTTRFTVDWEVDLYVAQKGTVRLDPGAGVDLDRVFLRASHGCIRIEDGPPGTWYIYAIYPGQDAVSVYVGSIPEAYFPANVVSPSMRFTSDRLFLPLDGKDVECGPYFYRSDGTRLQRSDFDPDLYETLLAFDLERSNNSSVAGRYWRQQGSAGNPIVAARATGVDADPWSFRIDRLSWKGTTFAQNYRISDADVDLEYIRAKCRVADSKVEDAEATLYTADPFAPSCAIGEAGSWAPAYWYGNAVHDEDLDFFYGGMIREGNDCNYATAALEPSDGRYSFSFPDRGTLRMTVGYDAYGPEAMPKASLTIVPGIVNRVTGEVYQPVSRFTASCMVHLSTGGVASANTAGGTTVSVEWGFPRCSLTSAIEEVVASTVDGAVKGMYTALYSLAASPEQAVSAMRPNYSFCIPGQAPTGGNLISGDRYVVPSYAAPGYSFSIWKYSRLYPDSRGWLNY